jgi:hypothetical protein
MPLNSSLSSKFLLTINEAKYKPKTIINAVKKNLFVAVQVYFTHTPNEYAVQVELRVGRSTA